ncbi:hypothetical protein Taro_000711 [Colocasia esculenta]|uniref:Uncharacterized protein n=1 Tax=Colocasia esculenta TaxID=4460 RepID=A0A843TCR4_COLES|nr:hypothetical protein [Colocasia esculenta]
MKIPCSSFFSSLLLCPQPFSFVSQVSSNDLRVAVRKQINNHTNNTRDLSWFGPSHMEVLRLVPKQPLGISLTKGTVPLKDTTTPSTPAGLLLFPGQEGSPLLLQVAIGEKYLFPSATVPSGADHLRRPQGVHTHSRPQPEIHSRSRQLPQPESPTTTATVVVPSPTVRTPLSSGQNQVAVPRRQCKRPWQFRRCRTAFLMFAVVISGRPTSCIRPPRLCKLHRSCRHFWEVTALATPPGSSGPSGTTATVTISATHLLYTPPTVHPAPPLAFACHDRERSHIYPISDMRFNPWHLSLYKTTLATVQLHTQFLITLLSERELEWGSSGGDFGLPLLAWPVSDTQRPFLAISGLARLKQSLSKLLDGLLHITELCTLCCHC